MLKNIVGGCKSDFLSYIHGSSNCRHEEAAYFLIFFYFLKNFKTKRILLRFQSSRKLQTLQSVIKRFTVAQRFNNYLRNGRSSVVWRNIGRNPHKFVQLWEFSTKPPWWISLMTSEYLHIIISASAAKVLAWSQRRISVHALGLLRTEHWYWLGKKAQPEIPLLVTRTRLS